MVAMGPGAARLAAAVVPAGTDRIEIAIPGAAGFRADWQRALDTLSGRPYPRDLAHPGFSAPAARGQLPRADLPYGTPRWVGSSGDRAVRPTDGGSGRPSPDYLKWFLPTWVAALPAAPLTAAEQVAADELG